MRRLICFFMDLAARWTCPVCGQRCSWHASDKHLRGHEPLLDAYSPRAS